MADALNSPYATLSFPHLFTPSPRAEGGEAVFSCVLLFSPEQQKSPEYKAMQAAVAKLAGEKFPTIPMKGILLPFRDAGEKTYAGYEPGMTYISPWSKGKPGIVDVRLQDVLDPAEVWAGQTVRAHITPFSWFVSGKRGISFGLQHLQIVKRDMPRIDGRTPAKHAFSALEDEAEEALI
jgi:hypothetical protein